MSQDDYYATLGLPPQAETRQIKEAIDGSPSSTTRTAIATRLPRPTR